MALTHRRGKEVEPAQGKHKPGLAPVSPSDFCTSCTSPPSNYSDHKMLDITGTGTKTLPPKLLNVLHAREQNKNWAKLN